MSGNVAIPSDFMLMLNNALEQHTDGVDYDGHYVGLARWDGDALLVPIVTAAQFEAGDMYIENAKKIFRLTLTVVK
jgi:hypothetical protein